MGIVETAARAGLPHAVTERTYLEVRRSERGRLPWSGRAVPEPGRDDGVVPAGATHLVRGAGGGNRTHDLTITSRLRYQLRHTGPVP